ncbi:hypothetical protein HYI36_00830 [Bacillus sp. Gen3]|uniref:hypothetical protein n=1 Tax=Heyndrickxia oleronia TaxID=38875 RepID=UPI0015D1DA9F|nr:hypothetical protein [Bacillus sp. Gen3]
MISIDVFINLLNEGDWKSIHKARLEHKKSLLKYTKHSKRRKALLKEIKWLEENQI